MRQQTSTVSQRPAGDDLELPGVELGSLEHNEVTAAASIGRLYVLETGKPGNRAFCFPDELLGCARI